MIIGLVILAVLAAVAYWASSKKDPTPECLLYITEIEEWCVFSDGSVSEPVVSVLVEDCYCEVPQDVTYPGEWS